MKTKRLTLESFKYLVKRIIKEEMYRNPEEKSSILKNDKNKSLELSKGIIKSIKNGKLTELSINTNINSDGNSLRIILNNNQEFIFDYYNDKYSFWKLYTTNTLTKEGAFKFLDVINEALDYIQINNPKTHSQEPRIIDFLTNPNSQRELKF
jgi:hypothetical protein